ncbi:MAG TPA: sodium-dependent transporter, partial [Marinobacter sp.]|nr:sodium-dependent transporter [Marinobacter sp.]
SYNVLGDFSLAGKNLNDTMDYFANQILLPLSGLMIALFAGWVMTRDASRDELASLGRVTYEIWRFMLRFVVPPALLVIFISGVTS